MRKVQVFDRTILVTVSFMFLLPFFFGSACSDHPSSLPLRRFFLAACDVPSLEDKFNVDQYSDLVTVTKPVIYISIGEIINTHTVRDCEVSLIPSCMIYFHDSLGCFFVLFFILQLLLDHQDAIAPEHNDPIHELLEDLGEVPTIESLIGESLRGEK